MAREKPTSRRDFLKGRAAARALLDRARDATESVSSSLAKREDPEKRRQDAATTRLTATRRAMACEFAVEYHAADGVEMTDAALSALTLIERIEDQLTVYRDHGEVITINETAADGPARVDPKLMALLELSAWLHEATGGAFDFTSGPLSKVWGFYRREGRLPDPAEIDRALEQVGAQYVQLEADGQTVQFTRPGVEINFNSIGKGYALDRASQTMEDMGAADFLWHGGNSSVLARGRCREHAGPGWTIGLPHPFEHGKRLGEIQLVDLALGTAGSGTQFFEAGGRRYGHVIDPRTGWPVEGVLTATAIADTAAEADALATAFYVMGPSGTAEYCAVHQDVSAVIVCPGGETDQRDCPIDVHTFNLDESRWRRLST